jgi:hypothetical protein
MMSHPAGGGRESNREGERIDERSGWNGESGG